MKAERDTVHKVYDILIASKHPLNAKSISDRFNYNVNFVNQVIEKAKTVPKPEDEPGAYTEEIRDAALRALDAYARRTDPSIVTIEAMIDVTEPENIEEMVRTRADEEALIEFQNRIKWEYAKRILKEMGETDG